MAKLIQSWGDIDTYVSQSKKEQQAQKFLATRTKFRGERYEMDMLWSEPKRNRPNNYGSAFSALGPLYSLKQRFPRDPILKELYQKLIDNEVEKGFVEFLAKPEVRSTFRKERYLPHQTVVKPGKDHRVCDAAARCKDV